MEPLSETTAEPADGLAAQPELSAFERGLIAGLLLGFGSWTGDRRGGWLAVKVPHHAPEPVELLQRLLGGRRYGPYQHSGRHYHLWRLQGQALLDALPLFDAILPPGHQRTLYLAWKERHDYQPPYAARERQRPAAVDLDALIEAARSS